LEIVRLNRIPHLFSDRDDRCYAARLEHISPIGPAAPVDLVSDLEGLFHGLSFLSSGGMRRFMSGHFLNSDTGSDMILKMVDD
jgi:hypothetical protein